MDSLPGWLSETLLVSPPGLFTLGRPADRAAAGVQKTHQPQGGRRAALLTALALVWCTAPAHAATFTGTYLMTQGEVTLTLTLAQDAKGALTGSLSSTKGARFEVAGEVVGGIAEGNCFGDGLKNFFAARLDGAQLRLALMAFGAGDRPDEATRKELVFTRDQSAGSDAAWPASEIKPPGGTILPSLLPPEAPASATPVKMGKEVGDPAWGFSLRIPAGWNWEKRERGVALGRENFRGFIVVFGHGVGSLEQMRQELAKAQEQEGISLQILESPRPLGDNALVAEYQGEGQGTKLKILIVGTLSPHGGGATVLAAGVPEDYAQIVASAQEIASSLSYTKPDVSALLVGEWKADEETHNLAAFISYTQFVALYPDGSVGWAKSEGGLTVRRESSPGFDTYTHHHTGKEGPQGSMGRWELRGGPSTGDWEGYQVEIPFVIHWKGSRGSTAGHAYLRHREGRADAMMIENTGVLKKGSTLEFLRQKR